MKSKITILMVMSAFVPITKANDTNSVIIQNSSARPVQVLIKQNLLRGITQSAAFPWQSGPATYGCIYEARIYKGGVEKIVKNVCKYPALKELTTTTYIVNPWPTTNTSSFRFTVYILDNDNNLLGKKKNVKGGDKIEFPFNFVQ